MNFDTLMDRAVSLAKQARGSVAPNPLVGAIILRDDEEISSGFHGFAGSYHAERSALMNAPDPFGCTMIVTLEPCAHTGRQPPCVDEIIARGIRRVVIGARDPNPITAGRGVRRLQEAGIEVIEMEHKGATRLVEDFAFWITHSRPYVTLKMACTLDGIVAPSSNVQIRLTGAEWTVMNRELRIEHDGVLVGAGTVRVDDPQLTVRPRHERVRPYQRVIMCETDTVASTARVFEAVEGYARTIVLAPAGIADRFRNIAEVADTLFIGDADSTSLDLGLALQTLREQRDIFSLLCEGGPTLGARLIAHDLVDRFYWAIAPRLLANPEAVPVLAGTDLALLNVHARFDSCERVGEDIIVSGTFHRV